MNTKINEIFNLFLIKILIEVGLKIFNCESSPWAVLFKMTIFCETNLIHRSLKRHNIRYFETHNKTDFTQSHRLDPIVF